MEHMDRPLRGHPEPALFEPELDQPWQVPVNVNPELFDE